KKVAKTYIIVREANKKTTGYHFHAILKLHTIPKKNWFIKGVHMNLQRVGSYCGNYPYGLSQLETLEYLHAYPMATPEVFEEKQDNLINKRADTSQRLYDHVGRVLKYMSKDLEFPAQYTDYIISIHGKNHAISTLSETLLLPGDTQDPPAVGALSPPVGEEA
uniref:hypothetical protein n=1 Tax=Polynucleobacter sp. TaxID=2029855 RepID=UPI004047D0B4